jgi:hypothetical protein
VPSDDRPLGSLYGGQVKYGKRIDIMKSKTPKSEKRSFHIGDVLSAYSWKLLSPGGMSGVFEIMNFLTRDTLSTGQLPRAFEECKPHLLRQHPQLAEIDCSGPTEETLPSWLSEMAAKYGETLELVPLPEEAHEFRDPVEELESAVGMDRIIVIEAPKSDRFRELYRLAVSQHKDGINGKDFIPITIEGQKLELRYFTNRGHGDDVEFMIFVAGHRYSRKSLIVYQDGRVDEEKDGMLPDFDKLPAEPHFPDNSTVLQIIHETLLTRVSR